MSKWCAYCSLQRHWAGRASGIIKLIFLRRLSICCSGLGMGCRVWRVCSSACLRRGDILKNDFCDVTFILHEANSVIFSAAAAFVIFFQFVGVLLMIHNNNGSCTGTDNNPQPNNQAKGTLVVMWITHLLCRLLRQWKGYCRRIIFSLDCYGKPADYFHSFLMSLLVSVNDSGAWGDSIQK